MKFVPKFQDINIYIYVCKCIYIYIYSISICTYKYTIYTNIDTNKNKPQNNFHVCTKCSYLETSTPTRYLSLYPQLEYQITLPINTCLIVLRTGNLKNILY